MKKCKSGYVRKENKCIKRTINPATWFNQKKRSYNPFKMWGAWVGPSLIVLLFILSIIVYNGGSCGPKDFSILGMPDYFNPGGPNCHGILFTIGQLIFLILILPVLFLLYFIHIQISSFLSSILMYIIPIIFWFLFGWGIHSLIRRLRK